MAISAYVSSATFSSGTKLLFGEDEIIVFVGPNNAGKTTVLRELLEWCANRSPRGDKMLKSIELGKSGSLDELLDHFRANFTTSSKGKESFNSFGAGAGLGIDGVERLRENWEGLDNWSRLCPFFIEQLDTIGRLRLAHPAPSIKLDRDPPQAPAHYMAKYGDVEKRISQAFRRAFGQDLIVHRQAGGHFPLYCGATPPISEDDHSRTKFYSDVEEQMSPIEEQGDGMKSFAGVIMYTLYSPRTVILIDEPEAFLHPPQARLVGQVLAKDKPTRRQLFLATHSGDLLRGLLDVDRAKVRVIRLQRDEDGCDINELDPTNVRAIWNDPLLRYSNSLDGVFHERVVVCEADADCRFYGALLGAIYDDRPDDRRPDVMFTHCGGKDRLPVIVRALIKLDVPVSAIADFDVLRDRGSFQKIVEALGGEWAQIESDWQAVTTAINGKRPQHNKSAVKQRIDDIFGRDEGDILTKVDERAVRSALSQASAWADAKEHGENIVSGPNLVACKRLLNTLREFGLFVVRVGELECFDKEYRTQKIHGPAWVNEVLQERNLVAAPELDDARKFVEEIVTG